MKNFLFDEAYNNGKPNNIEVLKTIKICQEKSY